MKNNEIKLLIKNELQYLKYLRPKYGQNEKEVYTKYKHIIDKYTKEFNKISEKLYCYCNDIISAPNCQYYNCCKKVNFISFKAGYSLFCCRRCGNRHTPNQTNEIFIKVHNSKYQYDWSTYVDDSVKMKIICPIHGEFWQEPGSHKQKRGCPKCGEIKRKNSKKLCFDTVSKKFNEIHHNKYTYDESTYINNRTKMRIICKKHGEFWQSPGDHKNGHGCPQCKKQRLKKLKTKRFSEVLNQFTLVHDNKYTYYEDTYINTTEKIKIKCNICNNVFWQKVLAHKQGQGCPKCNESKGELMIRKYLLKNNINFVAQKKFDECNYHRPLLFDFYLPDLNVCIEFQGQQHYKYIKHFHRTHDNFKICQLRDKIKFNYCYVNGIKLIYINEFDAVEIVLSKINY